MTQMMERSSRETTGTERRIPKDAPAEVAAEIPLQTTANAGIPFDIRQDAVEATAIEEFVHVVLFFFSSGCLAQAVRIREFLCGKEAFFFDRPAMLTMMVAISLVLPFAYGRQILHLPFLGCLYLYRKRRQRS